MSHEPVMDATLDQELGHIRELLHRAGTVRSSPRRAASDPPTGAVKMAPTSIDSASVDVLRRRDVRLEVPSESCVQEPHEPSTPQHAAPSLEMLTCEYCNAQYRGINRDTHLMSRQCRTARSVSGSPLIPPRAAWTCERCRYTNAATSMPMSAEDGAVLSCEMCGAKRRTAAVVLVMATCDTCGGTFPEINRSTHKLSHRCRQISSARAAAAATCPPSPSHRDEGSSSSEVGVGGAPAVAAGGELRRSPAGTPRMLSADAKIFSPAVRPKAQPFTPPSYFRKSRAQPRSLE